MSDIFMAYIKLGIAALIPVIAAIALYLLGRTAAFGRLSERTKQVIYGLVFGALAILGTEWGIPFNGAQANCRDAAVLIAGLMFGAPAGIIAGTIGAVERWIAVAWGIGTFTRVACTLSTFIAGFYAAALRKYLFEDKKPGFLIAFSTGVVMEVFHLTMVFITNMNMPNEAMAVVRACSVPMLTANGASVLLAAVAVTLLAKRRSGSKKSNGVKIAQTVQRWLFATVAFAFVVTTFFLFGLQDRLADTQTDSLLDIALGETAADISDASDKNLLDMTYRINDEIQEKSLTSVSDKYGVAEINVFDENGIVIESSVKSNIGENAADYELSSQFLCLLGDQCEFVQGFRNDATPEEEEQNSVRKYAGIKLDKGFLEVGFDAKHLQEYVDSEVVNITKNRHVGKTGYVIIINDVHELVSAPEGITSESLRKDGASIGAIEPDTTIGMTINGEEIFCRYRIAEGYYIISALPQSEALQLRDVAMYVNTFLEILVFAVLFALIYMLIKRVVVNQIKSINESLAKISNGNLDEVVDVRTNEEFASLSDDINSTVDTLKHYIDEASARIDKELEVAKDIQISALPGVFPAFPKRKDFDIFASMNPAKSVGGDFYDFYMTGNDTLNFLVADVSGKGIPAAMFMMRAKTELKRLTEDGLPIGEVFTHGNAALCEGNDAGMFVTAWQGNIDLNTGLVRFANAGHNPPLVRHKDGKFEYLKSRAGFVLAGMEGVRYKQQELQLEQGDIVYLYTDGVTEATNLSNELYGEDRLLEAINSREFEDMQEMCRFIKSEVDTFVGEAAQFDDITMLAFKYIGAPPVPTVHFDEASLENIPAVTEFVEGQLEKIGCPMKTVIQFNIAVDEIYSNIVKYGYPKTPGPVTVSVIEKEDPHIVCLRFADEGIPYNPLTNQDPDVTLSADERNIGGLGIYMVKNTMDDVRYKYENGQNILTIFKNI